MRLFKIIITVISFLGSVASYGSPPPPPPPCNVPQCSSGTYCYSNTNQCTTCPAGYNYIANPNSGVSSVNLWGCSICPAGAFSSSAGSASCTNCNAGSFSSSAGSTSCSACPTQTFSSNSGQVNCLVCSTCGSGSGTYTYAQCTPTTNTICLQCTPITNCQTTPTCSSAGNSQCSSCFSGYYLQSAGTVCAACMTCASGTYETVACTTNTNRQCSACLSSCPAGQTLSGSCSPTTNPICIACLIPNYYKSLTDGSPCQLCLGACPAGYQLNPTCSSTTNSVCNACSTGFYKTLADSSPCLPCLSACPAGFQLNPMCSSTTNSVCNACSTGFYKTLADSSPCLLCLSACPAGFQLNQACSAGANPECIACSAGGYYKALADGSPCLPCLSACPAGFQLNPLCSSTTNSICVPCLAGFYKVLADDSPCLACLANCGAGAYLTALCSATSNPSCELCPINTANPNQFSVFQSSCITCPNGAIAAAGSASCLQCPLGTATFGQNNCTNCAAGTYTDSIGSLTCKLCPSGTSNLNKASQNETDCLPCSPGYYSLAGATSCLLCPLGTYSNTAGTQNACEVCPSGAYNNLTGQTSCQLCPNGTANNLLGSYSSEACLNCLPGSFALTGFPLCELCPTGTSSNITGASSCRLCPLGTFISTPGTINAVICPRGYYSDTTGAINCKACQPGFIGNISGATNILTCMPCAFGYYVSSAGSTVCTICPLGFYQNKLGQASYQPCPAGTSNNGLGAISSDACKRCNPGNYQNGIGQAVCLPCAPGFYQNSSGQTACLACPAGTYNPAIGSAYEKACLPCLAGTFSAIIAANAITTCLASPPGTFIALFGSTNFTPCSPGMYQENSQQMSCLMCLAGTYNPLFGSKNSSSCIPAPLGFYVPLEGSAAFLPCQPGSYTNTSGENNCKLCLPGTFISTTSSTFCLPCPNGTFSLGKGFTLCEAIGITLFKITGITAYSLDIMVNTNFTALLPMEYICSDFCQIYVNDLLIDIDTDTDTYTAFNLNLTLGVDVVSVWFNGTFTSSLDSTINWTCEKNVSNYTNTNNYTICSGIPINDVVLSAVLTTERTKINPYADPAIQFASILTAYSTTQTYLFQLTNLEPAVNYSFNMQFANSAGNVAGSAITAPAVPTAPVKNLVKYFLGINVFEQANLEQANLQIHWEPPAQVDQHGTILGYNVAYIKAERSYITAGPDVRVIIQPAAEFSVFTNLTTLILTQLNPDSIYNITVYPLTNAIGNGPGASITLATQVSAPRKPPPLTLLIQTPTNVTVSWSSLSNETGIITKAWIVAEPYDPITLKNSSEVVHIPINTIDLPFLPFPHTDVKGFFEDYNASNPCQFHILGYTFKSILTDFICGGICDTICEYGTPMLDPTTVLPTNDQNLTNDNYLMDFNETNGTLLTRFVPYLTMKKRFVLNASDGGLKLAGKIVLGDGKINLNSLLNNTVLNSSLIYRFRLIVFTSETLYAISDSVSITPIQDESSSDFVKSTYIGILIAVASFILFIILLVYLKNYLKKNKERDTIIKDTVKEIQIPKDKIVYTAPNYTAPNYTAPNYTAPIYNMVDNYYAPVNTPVNTPVNAPDYIYTIALKNWNNEINKEYIYNKLSFTPTSTYLDVNYFNTSKTDEENIFDIPAKLYADDDAPPLPIKHSQMYLYDS